MANTTVLDTRKVTLTKWLQALVVLYRFVSTTEWKILAMRQNDWVSGLTMPLPASRLLGLPLNLILTYKLGGQVLLKVPFLLTILQNYDSNTHSIVTLCRAQSFSNKSLPFQIWANCSFSWALAKCPVYMWWRPGTHITQSFWLVSLGLTPDNA